MRLRLVSLGAAAAVIGLAFAVPSAAVAAPSSSAYTSVSASTSPQGRAALIPRVKAQMWNFTCSNPAPYQYQNATYRTGVPDQCLWGEAQELAYGYGYTGPVDGVMGPNSWKGFQRWLQANGYYSGAIDGVPGTQTYAALQRLAQQRGDYTGPIDGVMGPNSWKGVGYALNRILFAP